ncbi:MAG TPA: threonine/serine dehydratase [Chloroflexota bacterium]|nr:threonine/serine dehydratase [Chloroflexota bacterium]
MSTVRAEAEVTPARIAATARLIAPYVRRTPVVEVGEAGDLLPPRTGSGAGEASPRELWLKLELLQHAGSFKTRGAFANLLTREVPPAGVVAASGGNHGAAVAYAAMRRGVPARIFVPRISSPAKVERIRGYGAQLVVEGERYADALAASERWAAESGALPVHAFDQRETLLGQGTLALELEAQIGRLDTLLVAVGGGGLLGGIAAWYAGKLRLIGVEPVAAPTLTRALAAGRPVDAEAGGLAADSLAPRRVGELAFRLLQGTVERVVLLSDDDIRRGQQALWDTLRIVAEPGGAAAFAALAAGRYRPRAGERVGVVVSGGNTVAVDFSRQG